MTQKRTLPENKGLPERWRFRYNAYYYQVPKAVRHHWDGKSEFRLGKTLPEAHKTFAKRIAAYSNELNTMAELLSRYEVEVVITKKPATQKSNKISLERLIRVFGNQPVAGIKSRHVYQYKDACTKKHGATSYNRDHEVLSHAFSKAIEWGVIDEHPMKGKVTKNGIKEGVKPRDRYVEDWEVNEALKVASPFIQHYIHLKLITGLRKSDLLSITLSDLKEDGIKVTPRKTAGSSGKTITFSWTPELRQVINNIKELRHPRLASVYLFCTKRGQPYIKEDGRTSGFDSTWQRFIKRALEETKLEVRFTENDLRAKAASDTDLSHASKLLGHTNPSITDRVYRRKGEVVKPNSWSEK